MKAVRFIALAWVLPWIFSMIVYYGFVSNYTGGVFFEANFKVHYEQGIFKYRILGRLAHLGIHRWLEAANVPVHHAPAILKAKDPRISDRFYAAYFINNAVFLCLTCSVLFFIFNRGFATRFKYIGDCLLLMICLFIAITQYVVTPYDNMFYFLFTLSILFIIRWPSASGFAALCGLLVIATFTRETSALIPVFFFALHGRELVRLKPLNYRHQQLFVLILYFVVPYIALRIHLGFDGAFFKNFRLWENFRGLPLAGLAGLSAFSLIILGDGHNRFQCLLFLLGSLPYVAYLWCVAVPWEMRLWVPVIIGLIVLKVHPADRALASDPIPA